MKTTQIQRDKIQEFIQTELLKRSFTAKIISFNEVMGRRFNGNRLEFKTEPFQTVPVLFKEIVVCNFNSGFYDTKINESDYTGFVINVHVSYEHFGGGSNGCSLFVVRGALSENGKNVYDLVTE